MGRHKFLLLAVAVLVAISAVANLLGTYMIRPVVNSVVVGDIPRLCCAALPSLPCIYGLGALCRLWLHPDHGQGRPEGAL